MSKESRSASRLVGPRGVHLILVSCGLVGLAVLGALSVMGISALFNQGHPLRAAFLAMAPLLLLLLGARLIGVVLAARGPERGAPQRAAGRH